MNTITQLEEKLSKLLEELEKFTPGSDEHEGKLNEIKEVGDLLNKFRIAESDAEKELRNYEVKEKQMRNDNIDRIVGHSLTALGLLVSVGMGYWTFRFDEKGSVTSTLGRSILQRFVPKK